MKEIKTAPAVKARGLRRPSLLFVATLQLLQIAQAADLYVNAAALANGDGTATNPYWRITDAVVRSRNDRRNAIVPNSERIVIHVAAGTYRGSYDASKLAANPQWEILPIILNVPNLTLSGATVLDIDARGLPTGVHQGPETILTTPDSQLFEALHALILVARTTDGAAGDGVTITGFDLKQKQGGSVDAIRTFGIWVERVSGFEIRGNAFIHTPTGLGTRLASGSVQGNFCSSYGLGLLVLGGSINYPAYVSLTGNRCVRQGEGGIILGGAAGLAPLDPGANRLTVAPVQRAYDRSNPDDFRNLPDTLVAVAVGNDISDNTHFGIRLWAYPPGKYTTSDGILTSILRTTVSGNSFAGNGDHGVWVDGGWPERGLASSQTATLVLGFQNNSFIANGRAAALFSFTAAWTSIGLASVADNRLPELFHLSNHRPAGWNAFEQQPDCEWSDSYVGHENQCQEITTNQTEHECPV